MESTYSLEGDGALVVQHSINARHMPNFAAVSRQISDGNSVITQQCYQYGLAAVQPGWNYFNHTIMDTIHTQVEIFKAERLFNPLHMTSDLPVVTGG